MRIKEDEPLPKHTKVDWEECYAKVVLEKIYKDEFSGLKIKDRPDLQDDDNGIGIECTVAIDKSSQEAENLYIDLINNKVRNPDKCKERINKLGGKITEYMLFQSGTDSSANILDAVKIKLNKLNGDNYRIFKNNCLLIRDSIYMREEQIEELQYLIKILQSKEGISIRFDKIYILLNDKLIKLNMIDYTNEIIKIDSCTQYELAQKARKIVVEYEEGENEEE